MKFKKLFESGLLKSRELELKYLIDDEIERGKRGPEGNNKLLQRANWMAVDVLRQLGIDERKFAVEYLKKKDKQLYLKIKEKFPKHVSFESDNFEKLIDVGKFMTRRTKRNENLIDGIVYQEVSCNVIQKYWKILFNSGEYENLILEVRARLNTDGTKPKQIEKVWGVLNDKDELLLSKVSYKDALTFAKNTIKKVLLKNKII